MTDLRVDAAALREASASVLRAASEVRMSSDFVALGDDALSSEAVDYALRLGSRQQVLRAEIAAESLTSVGWAPYAAVAGFADADAALARAF